MTIWGAKKASLKIATAFLDEFEHVTRLLQSHQDLGTPGDQGMRIYPFRRFPYSVIYRENEVAGPQIYAVAHQNRKPGYWDVRL